MKIFTCTLAVTSAVVSVAFAQDTGVTSTLTAAETTVVPTSTPSSPPLFDVESIQLTDDVLADVAASIKNESISDLFAFGTDSTDLSVSKRSSRRCKAMPGDLLWPIGFVWDVFGLLLGRGRLIKGAPLAAACYPEWPQYNAAKCASLTQQWMTTQLHMADPTSIMLPLYEGRSCMPPGFNYTSTCEMGGYPSYVVNISSIAQIQLAVNFARNLNLRLVVKNTGHDFNGKASGKGALTIWTHWLKDKAFLPSFKAANGYVGPAIKFGSGVQVFEAYEYAKSQGVTVVGGEGYTVGLGGGYTAGGGHSPLSSLYGLAADQVLAMEVVMADGSFITATSTKNADVFWMLRGGGGSTIGVVTSLTIRAYPKLPTTTVTYNFTVADTPGPDAFWAAYQAYLDNFERFVDAGTYGYFYLGASAFGIGTDYPGSTDYYFRMDSFLAPNMTIDQTKQLLAPYFDTLKSLNVSCTPYYNYEDNYRDAWVAAFPQEYVGTDVVKTASRLIPRSVFQDDDLRNQTFAAIKQGIAEEGLFAAGFHISGKGIAVTPPTDNSVLPAWRNALAHVIIGQTWNFTDSWETIKDVSLHVTNWMEVLRELTPDSGAYMSEADVIEPNMQQSFYGSNYPRLYALKQKYDPTGLFFALTAVGAEDWEVQVTDPLPNSWNTNGKLCPV